MCWRQCLVVLVAAPRAERRKQHAIDRSTKRGATVKWYYRVVACYLQVHALPRYRYVMAWTVVFTSAEDWLYICCTFRAIFL